MAGIISRVIPAEQSFQTIRGISREGPAVEDLVPSLGLTATAGETQLSHTRSLRLCVNERREARHGFSGITGGPDCGVKQSVDRLPLSRALGEARLGGKVEPRPRMEFARKPPLHPPAVE